ncbi:hypothetical protein HOLleu_32357 [Holothuria leucospilota]|uniref:Uncharacterized protein n=1 Tax=Holothuria leucospilota TaxID=206669 RepID=A0A9Q1BIK5_HOLLE|nr:hypothetical protein HOLleu_32357 [Holothuria leucospilota]
MLTCIVSGFYSLLETSSRNTTQWAKLIGCICQWVHPRKEMESTFCYNSLASKTKACHVSSTRLRISLRQKENPRFGFHDPRFPAGDPSLLSSLWVPTPTGELATPFGQILRLPL